MRCGTYQRIEYITDSFKRGANYLVYAPFFYNNGNKRNHFIRKMLILEMLNLTFFTYEK